jgi:hypothetical protein
MTDINPAGIPNLTIPTETGVATSSDVTLYFDVNLKNGVTDKTGKPFNMTAVYAPDPSQLSDPVNVLFWFHGHKNGTTASLKKKAPNPKNPPDDALSDFSIQEYLNVDEYKLREFIAKTAKKKFILVAPTLNDMSGAGLLEKEAEAEAFLSQILNGINDKMPNMPANVKPLKSIGKLILAGHSGGGAIMSTVSTYGGTFARVTEIWCDDCTYGSGPTFKAWAMKTTSKGGRLWVFSTGSWDKTRLTDPKRPAGPDNPRIKVKRLKDPKKPAGPDNPEIQVREGTGDSADEVLTYALPHERAEAKAVAEAKAKAKKEGTSEADAEAKAKEDFEANSATIEEKIQGGGQTKNWTYGGARGHNESIEDYFAALVRTSKTLS